MKYTIEKRAEISRLIAKYLKRKISVKRPIHNSEIAELLMRFHGIDIDESYVSWIIRNKQK